MQFSMVNFILIGLLLLTIACILTFAVVDRYWGKRTLGGLVKSRSTLIYEGHAWWMEEVAMYVFISISITTVTSIVIILFFENHANEAFLAISPLYILSFMWIVCSIIATHPKKEKEE